MNTEWNQARKKFFGLATELGYEPKVIKEKAKHFFGNVSSFKDLSLKQIGVLTSKLEEVKQKRDVKKI